MDGAVNCLDHHAGTGVLVRGSGRAFLAACRCKYKDLIDLLAIVALACRDGMILARKCGFSKVTLESDCQELVTAWSRRDDRSTIACILAEVGELVLEFSGFAFNHVRRDANHVAHRCAKFACTSPRNVERRYISPRFLVSCIRTDALNVFQ